MEQIQQWWSGDFWRMIIERSTEWAVETVPSILVILLFAVIALRVVGYILKRVCGVIVARVGKRGKADALEQEKRVETLLGILSSSLRITIWAMILMLLLRKLGVDIAPLIAGAGIVGLAIGFGAQELVRDVISGFFMLLEDQIRAGDVAIINGTGGLVQSIGLRTTVLRDLSGVVHVFQNGKISSLSNMTKEWSAMVFDVGVAYKEDTDNVVAVMKEVAEDLRADPEFADHILEPLEVFGVDKFGDSAVVIKARIKTRPIQQWAVGREYRRRLKYAFDERGIEIPFPHRTVYWGAEIAPLEMRTRDERAA
ncbi:MAG: mechanosensitive ion channel [Chitinivibrionales bacterium]|nr:mechanosensitive ion channel [Chitinivibrionales bacterium]